MTRPLVGHDIGDIYRTDTGTWEVVCTCGWMSLPFQQKTYALRDWTEHRARERDGLVKR